MKPGKFILLSIGSIVLWDFVVRPLTAPLKAKVGIPE